MNGPPTATFFSDGDLKIRVSPASSPLPSELPASAYVGATWHAAHPAPPCGGGRKNSWRPRFSCAENDGIGVFTPRSGSDGSNTCEYPVSHLLPAETMLRTYCAI